jgi:hypothetical protein
MILKLTPFSGVRSENPSQALALNILNYKLRMRALERIYTVRNFPSVGFVTDTK